MTFTPAHEEKRRQIAAEFQSLIDQLAEAVRRLRVIDFTQEEQMEGAPTVYHLATETASELRPSRLVNPRYRQQLATLRRLKRELLSYL